MLAPCRHDETSVTGTAQSRHDLSAIAWSLPEDHALLSYCWGGEQQRSSTAKCRCFLRSVLQTLLEACKAQVAHVNKKRARGGG